MPMEYTQKAFIIEKEISPSTISKEVEKYALQHWICHPQNINLIDSHIMENIQHFYPGIKIYDYACMQDKTIITGLIGQFPFVIQSHETTTLYIYQSLQKIMRNLPKKNNLLYDNLDDIYPIWSSTIHETVTINVFLHYLPKLLSNIELIPKTYGFSTYAPILIKDDIPASQTNKQLTKRYDLDPDHPYSDNPYAWIHADLKSPTIRYEQGDSPRQAYEKLCSEEYNLSYHLIDKKHADPDPVEVYNDTQEITPDFFSMLQHNIDYIEYDNPVFTNYQKQFPEYNKAYSYIQQQYADSRTHSYEKIPWETWVENPRNIHIINASTILELSQQLPGVCIYSIEENFATTHIILAVGEYVCDIVHDSNEDDIQCMIKQRKPSKNIDDLEDLYLIEIHEPSCTTWKDVIITTFFHATMIAFSYNASNPNITQLASQGKVIEPHVDNL